MNFKIVFLILVIILNLDPIVTLWPRLSSPSHSLTLSKPEIHTLRCMLSIHLSWVQEELRIRLLSLQDQDHHKEVLQNFHSQNKLDQ